MSHKYLVEKVYFVGERDKKLVALAFLLFQWLRVWNVFHQTFKLYKSTINSFNFDEFYFSNFYIYAFRRTLKSCICSGSQGAITLILQLESSLARSVVTWHEISWIFREVESFNWHFIKKNFLAALTKFDEIYFHPHHTKLCQKSEIWKQKMTLWKEFS